MQKGDPLTVVGTAKLSTYAAKDGTTRAGLSITASRIITIADHQAPPKPKAKPKASEQQRYRRAESFMSAGPREYAADEFTDRVPF